MEGRNRAEYVWVGYSLDPPGLPIAIANSAAKLAKEMGVTENVVRSTWSHYLHGRCKSSRFHRVQVG